MTNKLPYIDFAAFICTKQLSQDKQTRVVTGQDLNIVVFPVMSEVSCNKHGDYLFVSEMYRN